MQKEKALLVLCLLLALSLGLERRSLSEDDYITDCSLDKDACELASKLSPGLLPLSSDFTQIHSDLLAIKEAYPDTRGIHAERTLPAHLILRISSEEALSEMLSNSNEAMEALNSEYGPVEIRAHSRTFITLMFEKPYSVQALIELYSEIEEVNYVEMDQMLGGAYSSMEVLRDGEEFEYAFQIGEGDCQAGCIVRHVWVFRVQEGEVVLVREFGQ